MHRFFDWLIGRVLPDSARAALMGDLEEDYRCRVRPGRSWLSARLWYGREIAAILAIEFGARLRDTVLALSTSHPRAIGQDVRYALRRLWRRPWIAAVTVLSLAVGIGTSTAIFTIADAVLLRPLPFADPNRLVALDPFAVFVTHGEGVSVAPAGVTVLPEFTSFGIYDVGGVNLGESSPARRLRAAGANSGFFTTLGVAPLLGRALSAEDDRSRSRVAVLSFDLWRGQFREDRDLIGRSIRLNGNAFQVVGVMTSGFEFPRGVDIWVPPESDRQLNAPAFQGKVIARLAPGASIPDATRALARAREAEYGDLDTGPVPPSMKWLKAGLAERSRPTLLFLGGLVSLLLATTCANIAGLLLAHLRGRSRELSVRASLGATRVRLAQQLMTESAVIGVAGSVAGFMLAIWMVRVCASAMPALTAEVDVTRIDLRVFLVGAALSTIALLLFAVGPAVAASRPAPDVVRDGTTSAPRHRRLASGLITSQLAVAVVLLAAASTAALALVHLSRVDLGFENDRAVVMQMTLPASHYGNDALVADFLLRLDARLRAIPGIVDAGATDLPPDSMGGEFMTTFRVAGTAPPPQAPPIQLKNGQMAVSALAAGSATGMAAVTPGYYAAMGIRLIAGRDFSATDATGPPVVILSESAARLLSPDVTTLVGQRVARTDLPDAVVIGIVTDTRPWGLDTRDEALAEMYHAIPRRTTRAPDDFAISSTGIAIASTGSLDSLIAVAKAAVHDVDPDVPVYNVTKVRDLRARFLATERVTMALAGVFSAMALGLAALGVYGLLSHAVAQRTREIGVRVALGASRGRLRAEVVSSAMRLAVIGVACGASAAALGWRLFAAVIPRIEPPGVWTLTIDAIVLLFVAALSAWIPARRASAVDPVTALRME